ncbi:MAG: hypothetical protein IT562_10860 [Alphaproteobacteria bacterium]|nr:hypothetical protein [Alphaproteobacteria bacterium]
MPQAFVIDKLGVIIQALSQTGNNIVATEEDGRDEWRIASSAYDMALPYAIEGGDWKFNTAVATLTRTGTPDDTSFADAYAKPDDLLHLIWVRLSDAQVEYSVLDNQIVLTANGGTVTAKYVKAPAIERVTPTFSLALTTFVMSGIYRGLHEDPQQADKMWAQAESILQAARTRADQEAPKRAMFNSRITMSRRVRRPWRPSPSGWGGTGRAE